jgi:integrase
MTPGSLGNAVRRIAKRARLPLTTLHGARHSTASFLLAEGVDLTTVSAILRHSAKSTTLNVYGHSLVGAQAEAVGRLSRRFDGQGNRRETEGPQEDEKSP